MLVVVHGRRLLDLAVETETVAVFTLGYVALTVTVAVSAITDRRITVATLVFGVRKALTQDHIGTFGLAAGRAYRVQTSFQVRTSTAVACFTTC